ncbi:MAG TPA: polysaccharide deacetylase family protein [Acidimicrobiales bacterium]|nr:polysaccharide deacetylase family protein [Acidimicrobiales bacterium]
MSAPDVSVPVVVLNLTDHGSLAIARSLGRWGVPVYGVHNRRTPAARSRYFREVRQVEGSLDQPGILPDLLALARELEARPLLIATGDASALLVEDHAAELREAFVLPDQPAGLARRLSDKWGMYELCLAHGVPTPHTARADRAEDVDAMVARVGLPVVFKAIDGAVADAAGMERTVISRTLDDARRDFAYLVGAESGGPSNYLLQEYIPGDALSVWMLDGYFDAQSRPVLSITGQKIHQCPPGTGPTSLGLCVPNDDVARNTHAFMGAIGYRGILDCGWRYDERDGAYKLLDVNPRVGATFRLFTDTSGMDVVRAAYLDLTGQPVEAVEPATGRRWVAEPNDLTSFLLSRQNGQSNGAGPDSRGLVGWIRDYRGVTEAAWWAADDVAPFAAAVGDLTSRMLQRGRHVVTDRLVPSGLPALALAYHGVRDVSVRHDPHRLFTSPAAMARQIDQLRSWGYQLVSFGDLAAAAASGSADGLVALTFDDGMVSTLTELLPVLTEHDAPATVFVVSGWDGHVHPDAPYERSLFHGEVRVLADAGVEIGSHSSVHRDLSVVGFDQAVAELRASRLALSDLTGQPIDVLAYPYGRASTVTREAAAAAGFRAACRTSGEGSWDDPLDLPRQDMLNQSTLMGLWLKRHGRYERLARSVTGRAAIAVRQRLLLN